MQFIIKITPSNNPVEIGLNKRENLLDFSVIDISSANESWATKKSGIVANCTSVFSYLSNR